MQRTEFGSNEYKLRRWLAQQFTPEWYQYLNVEGRSFNDLIHDPDIRLILGQNILRLKQPWRLSMETPDSARLIDSNPSRLREVA